MMAPALVLSAGLLLAAPLRAQEPLSAIEWLSQSVTTPGALPLPGAGAGRRDLPIQEAPAPQAGSDAGAAPGAPAGGAVVPEVTVQPLDTRKLDGAGVTDAAAIGLPRDLWANSTAADVMALLQRLRSPALPAVREALAGLLSAAATPPASDAPDGAFLAARAGWLMHQGAADRVQALLDRNRGGTPQLFRLWFDAALLNGDEDTACAALLASPGLSPAMGARIFCLARAGDWPAAALTFDTGRSLGLFEPGQEALLAHFLDAELGEGAPPLEVPAAPTPLQFRLFEAVGERLASQPLPLAFANADLGERAGWKAQLAAAERLARSGLLDPARLMQIYTGRMPAASGGVWRRVEAVQRLDTALDRRNPRAVSRALPEAWQTLAEADLRIPFAQALAPRLRGLPLDGPAGRAALEVMLLSPLYEMAARGAAPDDPLLAHAVAAALGQSAAGPAPSPLAAAIAEGFSAAADGAPSGLAAEGRLGEAILTALTYLNDGPTGDPHQITRALAFLRQAGMESLARRAAIELLLTGPRA